MSKASHTLRQKPDLAYQAASFPAASQHHVLMRCWGICSHLCLMNNRPVQFRGAADQVTIHAEQVRMQNRVGLQLCKLARAGAAPLKGTWVIHPAANAVVTLRTVWDVQIACSCIIGHLAEPIWLAYMQRGILPTGNRQPGLNRWYARCHSLAWKEQTRANVHTGRVLA